MTNYFQTKGKDGWVAVFGTTQNNQIPIPISDSHNIFGYKGDDTFITNSKPINQNKNIKDFGDNDKIQLSNYYAGTTYTIQNDNGTPVIYQNYGSNGGEFSVVRVEGDRKDEVNEDNLKTKNTKVFDFK